MNSNPSEITFYRLAREDAKIHRCDCGAWVYGGNPCGACVPAPVHRLRVTDPQVVYESLGTGTTGRDLGRIGADKCSPTAQTMGLRPLTRADRGAAL